VIAGGKHSLCGLLVNSFIPPQPFPQIIGGRECIQVVVPASKKVVLDDPASIGGVGELETEDLGVLLGLLQPIARRAVDGLRLHHGDRKIAPVPEQVICTLLRPALHFGARDYDAAISETLLFAYLVVRPVSRVKLRGRTDDKCQLPSGKAFFYCRLRQKGIIAEANSAPSADFLWR
jgi:hypothetical protein